MKNKNKFSGQVDYPTISEYRSKQLLNIATAVGIGVTAATVSLDLEAKDEKTVESKKNEASKPEDAKKNIILLVANLGNKDFKTRDKATSSLLTMGEKFINDKKSDLIAFMKKELEKAKKSKDPEVKERAKKILLSMIPPAPRRPNVRLDGDIMIPNQIEIQ